MKNNKLKIKHGAKVLALSIALATSSISMTGCAKDVETVVIEVDVNSSLFDLHCEYIKELITTRNAFISAELEGNYIRLPLGYRLHNTCYSDRNYGIVGVSVEGGYNIYQLECGVNEGGFSVPITTKGYIGVHDAIAKSFDMRDTIIADLKSETPHYGYRADAFAVENEMGGYRIVISDGYDLVHSKYFSRTGFEKKEYDGGLVYNISLEDLEKISLNIDDFLIVPNDVIAFLDLVYRVYYMGCEAYTEIAEKGKVETQYYFSK